MTGSTDDADSDPLPFQLPPSSFAASTPPTRAPAKPAPASQRPPARSGSFQGVCVPVRPASDHAHRRRPREDPSSSSPLRPKHDAGAAPTASMSRRADSSADRGEAKSLPWLSQPSPEPPAASKGAYGTRSGGSGRSNSVSQAASAGSSSLKIVLRPAKPDPSAASTLPTPSSSASPPVVVLDSSGTTSEASSRSESPAAPAAPPAADPLSAPVRSFPPSQTPELGSPAPSSSGASTPRPGQGERSSSRKGINKNGKDGLNRVCHHHKSQTDRPRMTCVNAPECKTVWCRTCVEKYYLACTPNAAFEAGVLFNCPVCQDACQCAGCKRKRRGYTRDGRRAPVDGDVTVPVSGGVKEKKAKKEKRGRENANVEVGLWAGTAAAASASGWEAAGLGLAASAGPVPGADEDDSTDDEADAVSRMLMGGVSAAVSTAPIQAPAAPAEEVPVIKRRSSLTSAYDRANPLTFAHMPPPTPVVATPAPLPSASAARRRSGAAARPPRQPDPYANLDASLPASFASTPTGAAVTPTAASSRPRRNKRPSSAFDDYALDLPTSSAAGLVDRNNATPISQYAYATSGSAARRRGGPAPNSRQPPSGIEALANLQPRRKIRRRWHSGLSSASSCDDLSMSDDDFDDDSMDEGEGSMMVVEEPLPVLAGLERNLGLEGDGTPPDGMLFGEVFGVVGVADPALAGALAGGAAVQLDPTAATAAKPLKPKVKWIKGPQRKKWEMARAAEAAAAMGSSTVAKEEPKEDKLADAEASKPPPSPVTAKRETLSVSPSDPIKPFKSPSEPPKRNLAVPITASDEESPPSYDSHDFVPRQATASISTSAPPSTSAQPSQPSAQPSPSRAALASRSPDDARLAFALLDAVRAAVGPRTSETASTTSAEPDHIATANNFGAALEAALGSNGTSSAMSSPSKAPFDARGPSSSAGGSLGSAMEVDDYEAREREAERRRQQQAAQAVVDPGKAFKPTAKDDTQLFVGSPVCDVDDEADAANSRQAGYAAGVGLDFDFDMLVTVDQDVDAPTPVDDLWTPASAADSLSTTPSTAASSAMPTSAPFDEPACSVAPSASLAAEYPFFHAAVVSGITPLSGTPMRDLSGLSGLELEVGISTNLDKAMWADDLAVETDSRQAIAAYLAAPRTTTHAVDAAGP